MILLFLTFVTTVLATYRRPDWLTRRYCSCLLVLPTCLTTGCQPPISNKAEYDNGIYFEGSDGVVFMVGWICPKEERLPCPLVIHLTDQISLGEPQFSSPKFMLELGGETRNQFQNSYDICLSPQDGPFIWVDYEQQKMTGVGANIGVNHSSGKPRYKFTVDGKVILLPISIDEVVRACGKPRNLSATQLHW